MFDDLVTMFNLAMDLAPLIFLLVVGGAVFRTLRQFMTGEVFGLKE